MPRCNGNYNQPIPYENIMSPSLGNTAGINFGCFGMTMPQMDATTYTTSTAQMVSPQTNMPPISQAVPKPAITTSMPVGEPVPQTVVSPLYTAGFLRSQIGKKMRVEFLIGSTGALIDRSGTLIGVGTSYILLRPTDSDDIMLCDLYSVKFVTILL